MNRVLVAIVIVFVALVAIIGCGEPSVVVREYCDSETSYAILKAEPGYRLVLRVGKVDPGVCQIGRWRYREINLETIVSSPEEADRLIDKYRRLYAEKVSGATEKKR